MLHNDSQIISSERGKRSEVVFSAGDRPNASVLRAHSQRPLVWIDAVLITAIINRLNSRIYWGKVKFLVEK